MEFLKTVKRRTFWSEVAYYALNLGLVVVLVVLTQTIQSPLLAALLVLLSKWRVFAVRPRYWWTNIQANMVDTIVGVSIVALMYQPGLAFGAQIAIAGCYALWLLVIKPLSRRWQMLLQAAIAIGLGSMAVMMTTYEWPSAVTVLAMFVVGYSAARHFLFSYDEEQIVLLSLIWGALFAELGWLAHYWNYGYRLPGAHTIQLSLPQVTLIALLLSFLGERVYRSWKKHGMVVAAEVVPPAALVGSLVLVMMLAFNSVTI